MLDVIDRPHARGTTSLDVAPIDIVAATPAARFIFRGGEEAARLAGIAFGIRLPHQPCRSESARMRNALWLGPDEWLLFAAESEGRDVEAGFAQALGNEPHSLVDVGDRQVGLVVRGGACAEVLNAGCPLDLDEAAFPVGMCARTVFEKAEIVLWRTEPFAFQVEVWRSFTPYVHALLAEAAREHAG
jgi:sarcosine oxidase, subunit gamma